MGQTGGPNRIMICENSDWEVRAMLINSYWERAKVVAQSSRLSKKFLFLSCSNTRVIGYNLHFIIGVRLK